MKLIRPLIPLAFAAALSACDDTPTAPPFTSTDRPLTPAEVTAVTTRARTDLTPALATSLRSLAVSQLLGDLDLEIADAPDLGDAQVLDTLLSEAAIESRVETQIVYRVRAEDVCDGDAGCAATLAARPVRLVATSAAVDAVSLTLEVGEARLRPARVDLTRDSAWVFVDLAVALSALRIYAPDLDLDPARLPAQATGAFDAELRADGVRVRADTVNVAGLLDGEGYRMALSEVALSLQIDAVAHTVIGHALLVAPSVEVPFGWLASNTVCTPNVDPTLPDDCVEDRAEGALRFQSDRVGASIHFDADTDLVVLEDLVVAPVGVTLDQVPQLSLAINAAQGNQVDMSLRYLRQELEIAVSPSLEATLALSMASVAAQVELPEWAVSDTVRLRLDGATSPTVRLSDATDGPQARVVSGALTVSSQAGSAMVTAAADQCLGFLDDAAEDAHLVEALMTFACE